MPDPNQIPRRPGRERAGTHLDYSTTEKIFINHVEHGSLDRRNAVWQHGGESKNFIHHNKQAITMSYPALKEVKDAALWIEMIDSDRNECYRVPMATALATGYAYDGNSIGWRWAVPLEVWTVYDKDWNVVEKHYPRRATQAKPAPLPPRPPNGPLHQQARLDGI